MAEFTRKALKEIFSAADIEVPKDVLGQLCDLHTESIEDSGETIKDLKNKLKTAENERDKALKEVPDGETVSKKKYDDLKTEYDTYKTGIEEKEANAKKSTAVKELLKKAGISEKHLDSVMRVYQMDDIELDDKGKIKDAEDREKSIKADWADFIVAEKQKGADTPTPPGGDPTPAGPKTLAEALRQKYDTKG